MSGHRLDACASCVMLLHRIWSLGSVGIFGNFFSLHWHSLMLKFYMTGFHGYISTFLTGILVHWMMCRDLLDSVMFPWTLACNYPALTVVGTVIPWNT